MLKKLFVYISPLLVIATSRIRPLFLIRAIRLTKSSKLGKALRVLWDPNFVRKKLEYRFVQRLITEKTKFGSMVLDINDHIGYCFFMDGHFDRTVENVAKILKLDQAHVFIDIGANIGTTSIPIAKMTNCTVFAVEASKANASILLKNAYINNIKIIPIITCLVDKQMAQSEKWLEFSIRNGNTGTNSIYSQWNPSLGPDTVEFVSTSTFDDLISDDVLDKVRLVKIDVEGAEPLVLKGGSKLLGGTFPILLEYRIDALSKYLAENGDSLIDVLEIDFEVFAINEECELMKFDRHQSYPNILAIPRKRLNEIKELFN